MARAYGSSAHLFMKRETTYGQAATGNYLRMPFNRCNLGSEQGLIDDPVLGQGRDPLAPLQDVITDEGDIVVPVDPRYLGLWLTGLFGDPDTTDNLDGSWDHEFASGGEDLPSYTIDVGMPKVPAFFRHAGVKLNSIALEFTRSGPAAATISAIAQGETRFGTTQGGTPTSLAFSRISQFHVWTAPALQGLEHTAMVQGRLQPCIRPLVAAARPLALMGFADRRPTRATRFGARETGRV